MSQPNVSSELLRTFIAVVDADGFQRAATRLHKTQSTVSQQVQRLEEEVGVSLFEAAGRKRRLTTAGETFVGYARRLLELQDAALAAVAHPQLGGALRLGVSNSLSDGPLARTLAGFIRCHPQVQLHVKVAYSADLLPAYERGEYDAVIVLQPHGKGPPGQVLETSQMVWIGAQGYLWDPSQPLPLATFDCPCAFHRETTEALDRARIPWRLVYTTSSIAGLITAVRAGIAVTARTPHAMQPGTELIKDRFGLPELPSYDVVLLRNKSITASGLLEETLRRSALEAG